MRFGISFALAFIFLPIYLILCLLIFSPWWLAIMIFIAIPLSGLFAWSYNLLLRRITGGLRVRKYLSDKNKDFSALRLNYDELISLVSELKDE
jgi:ABC-type bacteriocin/lantibiotic exporter with double-glycine peptidase domain